MTIHKRDQITERKYELKKQIRAMSRGLPRKCCYICGRYKSVTHLHHVNPVSTVAESLAHRGKSASQVGVQILVWLCPTHHAYWHALKSTRSMTKHLQVWKELTPEEQREFDGLDDHVFEIQQKMLLPEYDGHVVVLDQWEEEPSN